MTYIVSTFYQFVTLEDCQTWRSQLLAVCQSHDVKGTILLAPEGINATIAGAREGIDAVVAEVRSHPNITQLDTKESIAQTLPFQRMKVKLKREIVTFGVPEANPAEQVGTYVDPAEWNALIQDPAVTVIDTRNAYEVKIGTFAGAIDPQTATFREFPAYVATQLDPARHKKVAMFCTGGIRCEKASSYLMTQGFEEVYHLKGGILNYLEETPSETSLWQGECFVFDERVAVQEGVQEGSYEMCLSCGHPISEMDQSSSSYEAGISCPYCIDHLTEEKRQRQVARVRSRPQSSG